MHPCDGAYTPKSPDSKLQDLKLVLLVDYFGKRIGLAWFRVSCFGLMPHLWNREPVVLMRLVGHPRWQGHAQVIAECRGVAFIERTEIPQPLVRLPIAAYAHPALAKKLIELFVTLRR